MRALTGDRDAATAALTNSSRLISTDLCSLLWVAFELPEFPLSFSAAIQRTGGFVSLILAHSIQRLFYGGCSRPSGLRMEQLRELE